MSADNFIGIREVDTEDGPKWKVFIGSMSLYHEDCMYDEEGSLFDSLDIAREVAEKIEDSLTVPVEYGTIVLDKLEYCVCNKCFSCVYFS